MKPLYHLIVFIFFNVFPQICNAQLFTVISDFDADLTSEEQMKLDTIRANQLTILFG